MRLIKPFTNAEWYHCNPYSCQERDEFYASVYYRGGIENVRGWLHCAPELLYAHIQRIHAEVCAHFDLCYKCGFKSHSHHNCVATCVADWKIGKMIINKNDEFND